MTRLHGAMAVTILLAFGIGVPTVYTQEPAGRGRQGGPPTYRLWWVAKAKPGQYGTNKPHIKLVDLKERLTITRLRPEPQQRSERQPMHHAEAAVPVGLESQRVDVIAPCHGIRTLSIKPGVLAFGEG